MAAHRKDDGGPVALTDRQRETAQYLSDMILELRNLARTVQLHEVMVPLEFAYYEAFGLACRVEISSEDMQRIEEIAKSADRMDRDPNNRGI